jgi:hypothetical protein
MESRSILLHNLSASSAEPLAELPGPELLKDDNEKLLVSIMLLEDEELLVKEGELLEEKELFDEEEKEAAGPPPYSNRASLLAYSLSVSLSFVARVEAIFSAVP